MNLSIKAGDIYYRSHQGQRKYDVLVAGANDTIVHFKVIDSQNPTFNAEGLLHRLTVEEFLTHFEPYEVKDSSLLFEDFDL